MVALYIFLGIIIGVIGTVIFYSLRTATGVLHIDHHDPEKDYHLFEIDNIEQLYKRRRIVLKVNHNASLQ